MSWRIGDLSIAIIFPKTTIRVTEVKKNKIKWSLHVFCCLPCRNVRLVLVSMADMYQKQWHSFPVSSPLDSWEVYKFSVINGKYEKKKVENPGIDPGTSRMRSRRSTAWANSPATATYINTLVKIVRRKAQPVLQLCSLILSFTTHLTSLILYQRRTVFKLQLKDFGGLTKTNVIWASGPATTTNGFS